MLLYFTVLMDYTDLQLYLLYGFICLFGFWFVGWFVDIKHNSLSHIQVLTIWCYLSVIAERSDHTCLNMQHNLLSMHLLSCSLITAKLAYNLAFFLELLNHRKLSKIILKLLKGGT